MGSAVPESRNLKHWAPNDESVAKFSTLGVVCFGRWMEKCESSGSRRQYHQYHCLYNTRAVHEGIAELYAVDTFVLCSTFFSSCPTLVPTLVETRSKYRGIMNGAILAVFP